MIKRRRTIPRSVRLGIPACLLAIALLLVLATSSQKAAAGSLILAQRQLSFHPALVTSELSGKKVSVDEVPLEFQLNPGQTLGGVLGEFGLASGESSSVIAAIGEHLDFRRLRAGAPYWVYFDEHDSASGFEFRVTGEGTLAVRRGDSEPVWQTAWRPYVKSTELRVASGVLESTLSEAIESSGGPFALAIAMSQVLQWDLDFNRDLRQGDQYQVLYEAELRDGEYYGIGRVLGLSYDNRGTRFEAYYYPETAGYYDAEGQPLAKMFLKSPLPFTRITSRFNLRRFHPVLKKVRPHYGVDYGAPTGTPVRATAAGTVTFAGWNRGGGKTVKIRHANGYLSAYLHLSRFASVAKPGRRIDQGEVIGFVGSTGLSTGPHLDYRVQHRGKWIDPLSIKNVKADTITPNDLPSFLQMRDELRASLDSGVPPARPMEALPLEGGERVAASAGTESIVPSAGPMR